MQRILPLLYILFAVASLRAQNPSPKYYDMPIDFGSYFHSTKGLTVDSSRIKKTAERTLKGSNSFLKNKMVTIQSTTSHMSNTGKRNNRNDGYFIDTIYKRINSLFKDSPDCVKNNLLYQVLTKAEADSFYGRRYFAFRPSDSSGQSILNTFFIQLTNISETKITPTNILTIDKDPKYTLAFPLTYLFNDDYFKEHQQLSRNRLLIPSVGGSMAAKDGFTTIFKEKKLVPETELNLSSTWLAVKRVYYDKDSIRSFRRALRKELCKDQSCPCASDSGASSNCYSCICKLLHKFKYDTLDLSIKDVDHIWMMWFTGKIAWNFKKYTLYFPNNVPQVYSESQFHDTTFNGASLVVQWNNYVYHYSGFSSYTSVSYATNSIYNNIDDLKTITAQPSLSIFDTLTNTTYVQKKDDLTGKEGAGFTSGWGHSFKFRQVFLFGSISKHFYLGLGTFFGANWFNKATKLDAGFSIEAPIENSKDKNVVNLSLTFKWTDVAKRRNNEEKKKFSPLIGFEIGVPLPNLYMKNGGK